LDANEKGHKKFKHERGPNGLLAMKMNLERTDAYEDLVCKIVNGTRKYTKCPYDVESASGKRLEIKGSALRAYGRSENPKWHWNSLLGGGRQPKIYDQLILVGDYDEGARPQEAYMYFDVPYLWVVNYVQDHGPRIACPFLVSEWGIGKQLYQFELKERQLHERYGKRL
jgi:hypothetical protein